MSYFMGIDLGTSSLKAVIINETGTVVEISGSSYSVICRKNGYAEQEPENWWQALKAAIGALKKKNPQILDAVAAIGFSGQMHGTVLLDKEYQVLRPAIIHCDARTEDEVREIYRLLGAEAEKILMNPIATGIMLPTLCWVKKHEQKILEKTKYTLLPKDYLRFRMTGTIGTDYSDASATLAFDMKKGKWAERVLEKVGLPVDIFPPFGDSTMICGAMTEEAARELGLKKGIPVVLGGADQVMQSIGCGAVSPGQATANIGSGGQICIQTGEAEANPKLGINTFQGYARDRWYVMGAMTSAGSSLRWLNQILDQKDYDEINKQVSEIKPGSDGLIFLPYLSGERCPRLNGDISGVFWGLSYLTDRARLTRAVMEGVTYAMRSCLDACKKAGAEIYSMTAIGGGNRSEPWLQMQADMYNVELKTTLHQEQAGYGAAMIAAVGIHYFPDIQTASKEMIRYKDRIIRPRKEIHECYEEYYRLYQEIYEKGQATLEAVTRLGRR